MASKLFGNNKGQILFLGIAIILVVIIFILAMTNTFTTKILGEINSDIQGDDDMTNQSKLVVSNMNDQMSTTLDNSVLMIMTLLFIIGFGAAWFSDSHPLFLIVTILIMVVLLISGIWFSNAWDDFSSEEDLASSVAQHPLTDWMLSHFLMVNVVMVFLMVVLLGVKNT